MQLQRQAESSVATVQASMEEKSRELKAVNTAKHIAEAQVTDLQLRILALQQQKRARQHAADSATQVAGKTDCSAKDTIVDDVLQVCLKSMGQFKGKRPEC